MQRVVFPMESPIHDCLFVSLRRMQGLAVLKLFFGPGGTIEILDVGLTKEILVSMLDVLTGYF